MDCKVFNCHHRQGKVQSRLHGSAFPWHATLEILDVSHHERTPLIAVPDDVASALSSSTTWSTLQDTTRKDCTQNRIGTRLHEPKAAHERHEHQLLLPAAPEG